MRVVYQKIDNEIPVPVALGVSLKGFEAAFQALVKEVSLKNNLKEGHQ